MVSVLSRIYWSVYCHGYIGQCIVTDILASVLSRIYWSVYCHGYIGPCIVTDILASVLSRIYWSVYCHGYIGQCIVTDILVSGFLSRDWQSIPSKNCLHEVYSLKRKCQFHANF